MDAPVSTVCRLALKDTLSFFQADKGKVNR
jgi:hypothetical protein